MNTKLKIFLNILLFSFFVLSCSSSSDGVNLPKDVKEKVMQEANQDECNIPPPGIKTECRDFKIVRVIKTPLSNADKANGITEKWCVAVKYLRKVVEWEERQCGIIAERKNGKLKVYSPLGRVGCP